MTHHLSLRGFESSRSRGSPRTLLRKLQYFARDCFEFLGRNSRNDSMLAFEIATSFHRNEAPRNDVWHSAVFLLPDFCSRLPLAYSILPATHSLLFASSLHCFFLCFYPDYFSPLAFPTAEPGELTFGVLATFNQKSVSHIFERYFALQMS